MSHIPLHQSLRNARHNAGLTQTKAAELTGLRQSFVSRHEASETDMKIETIRKYAKAYGVTAGKIVDGIKANKRGIQP